MISKRLEDETETSARIRLSRAISEYNRIVIEDTRMNDFKERIYKQKKINEYVNVKKYNQIMSESNSRQRYKLNMYKHCAAANYWLRVRPAAYGGIKYFNKVIVTALKRRFDAPINIAQKRCERCQEIDDEKGGDILGDHAMLCSKSPRHHSLYSFFPFCFISLHRSGLE